MARDTLTPKQDAFLRYYLGECHGNGTAAARKAGYRGNEVTLRQSAHDVLTNPHVQAALAAWKAEVRATGIAELEQRIAAQHDRWDRLRQLIATRAADPSLTAPGADTGLLVRTYKALGRGEDFQVVEEYALDTGLLAELRQLEQHTAKELGQWVEKVAPTTPDGARPYADLSDDDLTQRIRTLLQEDDPGSTPGGA
jgi:hypothetical protein